jgi:excisionase family DNA binding protein
MASSAAATDPTANSRAAHKSSKSQPLRLEDYPTLGTLEEACAVLRCSRQTGLRIIARGALRATKHAEGGSSRLLISKRELERYVRELEGGTL